MEQNVPENLQKQGIYIPGYRPGESTRRYLDTIRQIDAQMVMRNYTGLLS